MRVLFPGSWDSDGPASGPGGRGSTAPGAPSLIAGTAWRCSGGLRQGGDPFPGGHDVSGPGPAGLDLQAALAAAAGQPGGGVQDAVAQGLRSALARDPSRASRRSQASRAAAVRAAACQALFIASEVDGYLPMPQSLPVRTPLSSQVRSTSYCCRTVRPRSGVNSQG